MLSSAENILYNRHLIMPEIGIEGQQKLKASKVLVIGAGGLGCPVLQYLTAAGVGTIGIVEFDKIDQSNLQRQILYKSKDVGKYKSEVAYKTLLEQNPNVTIRLHQLKIEKSNVLSIVEAYDLVIDGSDNFSTRYLINDACVILNKPLVFGSIYKFEGQVSVFNYQDGPTYRCLFPDPPLEAPNCSTIGVIGVLPGIIGCLQAMEAIKIITAIGQTLSGRLLVFEALSMHFQEIQFEAIPENKQIKTLGEYSFENCSTASLSAFEEISPLELKEKIDASTDIQIIDVREVYEYEICNLKGLLIPFDKLVENEALIRKDIPVIVHCYKGTRSRKAIELLQNEKGFTNLINLSGGIYRWFEEVDASLKMY